MDDAEADPQPPVGAPGGVTGLSLLDAGLGAGAAIDAAQVLSDLAARRVVQNVARPRGTTGRLRDDALWRVAVESERIAEGLGTLAGQYEHLRRTHLDVIDDLLEAADPEAASLFTAIETAAQQAEAAATALLFAIDDAERHVASLREAPRAVAARHGAMAPVGAASPGIPGTTLH